MANHLKSIPRCSFNFRYTNDVKKAIDKIMKEQKIKFRNEAICLALLKVANNNIEVK